MARGWSIVAGVLVVSCAACASSPEPQPAEPPPPPPKVEEPPPPPPPPPKLAVTAVRGVATESVPQAVIEKMSAKVASALSAEGQRNTVLDLDKDCNAEPCQLEAAKQTPAEHLLHTRIVQYLPTCIVLGTLYNVSSGRGEWGFSKTGECAEGALDATIEELAKSMAARQESAAGSSVFAVAPLQHKMQDLAWATESLAEHLTSLLAAQSRTVVAATAVAKALADKGPDLSRACGNKACAQEAGKAVGADRVVVISVAKRGKGCAVDATTFEVASGKGAKEKTITPPSCAAQDIAGAMELLAENIASKAEPAGAKPAEKPSDEPPDKPAQKPADKPSDPQPDDASAL